MKQDSENWDAQACASKNVRRSAHPDAILNFKGHATTFNLILP
jgi:hypothetical protein